MSIASQIHIQSKNKLFSRLSSGMLSICGVAIAVTLLFSTAAPAAPVVLYDSIGGTSASDSDTSNNVVWLANQFNTDVSSYNIDSVVVDLVSAPTGVIALDLYSDNAGDPGTKLGTFTNPGSFGGGSNTFLASGIPTLASASSFWVVLRGVGTGSSVAWNWTGSTPTGAGSSTNTNASGNGGQTWGGIASGQPYMMTVNATPVAVPEPSTWAMGLAGVAFAGFKVLGRRRRQS